MKKIIIIALACLTIICILTGCTKVTECAECHLVRECKRYILTLGDLTYDEYICEGCYTVFSPYFLAIGGQIKPKQERKDYRNGY